MRVRLATLAMTGVPSAIYVFASSLLPLWRMSKSRRSMSSRLAGSFSGPLVRGAYAGLPTTEPR